MTLHRKTKIKELLEFDNAYQEDYLVIGVDEAGRGPVAGPVTAGAVCFSDLNDDIIEAIKYLDDSKKFSSNPKLRKELSLEIAKYSVNSVYDCTIEEIAKINILQASLLAMKNAANDVISRLNTEKKIIVLVDGNISISNFKIKQNPVIKGDSLSASIAAASILAKVHRDELMLKYAEEFPQYEWSKNKGYPTKKHLALVKEYGLCKWHRSSFSKKFLQDNSYHQLHFIE